MWSLRGAARFWENLSRLLLSLRQKGERLAVFYTVRPIQTDETLGVPWCQWVIELNLLTYPLNLEVKVDQHPLGLLKQNTLIIFRHC